MTAPTPQASPRRHLWWLPALAAVAVLTPTQTWGHPHSDHGKHGYRKELKVRLTPNMKWHGGQSVLRVDILEGGLGAVSGHGVKFYVHRRQVHAAENVRASVYEWRPASLARFGVENPIYLIVNVCDHHDNIGVAATYLTRPRGGTHGAVPLDALPEGLDYLAMDSLDFTLRGVKIGCCGSGALWSSNADTVNSVVVEAP